ncbi:MAG: DUF2862 domain-containing protein [Timaviella obliquedivisa GSE-PSE-MK23-08B]|jgi:hypothetical protein|nr:DUF2862 domain-containing protein [Timaviella obliquedivisa GSE-PSE-MK23-08B]
MEIGQRVRVRRLRDRTSQEVIDHLGQYGVIKDYKVMDGNTVGRVVKFDDSFTTWFFEDELEPAA